MSWEQLPLRSGVVMFMLSDLVEFDEYDDMVLIAPKRHRSFDDWMHDLKLLRQAGGPSRTDRGVPDSDLFAMSLISDFFVAGADEASGLEYREILQRFPVVQGGGIDPSMIGDLDFLVTGERHREPVLVHDGGENWTFRLDPTLVRGLAALNPDKIEECADEWLVDLDGTDSRFLADVAALARRALDEQKELYLYVGL